jgi:hypothetical protein
VREIAAFASSDVGKSYAQVERFWGRDPAAFLEPVDDVLAHNLRVALVVALHEDATDGPHEEAARHVDLVERARRTAAELRASG